MSTISAAYRSELHSQLDNCHNQLDGLEMATRDTLQRKADIEAILAEFPEEQPAPVAEEVVVDDKPAAEQPTVMDEAPESDTTSAGAEPDEGPSSTEESVEASEAQSSPDSTSDEVTESTEAPVEDTRSEQ